jgi:hypothetical protein
MLSGRKKTVSYLVIFDKHPDLTWSHKNGLALLQPKVLKVVSRQFRINKLTVLFNSESYPNCRAKFLDMSDLGLKGG